LNLNFHFFSSKIICLTQWDGQTKITLISLNIIQELLFYYLRNQIIKCVLCDWKKKKYWVFLSHRCKRLFQDSSMGSMISYVFHNIIKISVILTTLIKSLTDSPFACVMVLTLLMSTVCTEPSAKYVFSTPSSNTYLAVPLLNLTNKGTTTHKIPLDYCFLDLFYSLVT